MKKKLKLSITLLSLLVVVAIIYTGIIAVRHFATSQTDEPSVTNSVATAPDNGLFTAGTLANSKQVVNSIEEVPLQGGWINTAPLNLPELQQDNHVILFNFWTYTCINCLRSLPYAQELWERYKDYGLVVIGVHSPEFAVERSPKNIEMIVRKAGVTYPVLTDGNMAIWGLFDNHFWPGKYLVSPDNEIVFTYFGEGNYLDEEKAVRKALQKAGWTLPVFEPRTDFLQPNISQPETPELYAGVGYKQQAFGNKQQPQLGKVTTFNLPKTIAPDRISLKGSWLATTEYEEATTPSEIKLNYLANTPYLVLDYNQSPLRVEVTLDEKPVPEKIRGKDIFVKDGKTYMTINEPRLYYPVADDAPYGRHILTVKSAPGLRLYLFTFGSY